MRAIQSYLPHPRHVELHRITVSAPPDAAWYAARHFDGADIPWVRVLFDLRTLPSKLLGQNPPSGGEARLGVDSITSQGAGFRLLEEVPGTEVVVGAIGRFWELDIPFASVEPGRFAAFAARGWGKVAWSIRVEPFDRGSQITLELRTSATDDDSWTSLNRYFSVIGPFSHLIRSSVMAHLESVLGPLPRPSDADRRLPGDQFVPAARYSLTHGIDIEAPRALVWPWLMQLGCDRGGWYSIDALDNGGLPSVEQLNPEWPNRRVGERIAATPKSSDGFQVRAVEPEALFVLGSETDRLGTHLESSWSFVLEPLGDDATHLTTRVRARGAPRWSEWLQGAVLFPPVHALMQHAQLHNLGRLAEREAQKR
jgi:hypothetical protein